MDNHYEYLKIKYELTKSLFITFLILTFSILLAGLSLPVSYFEITKILLYYFLPVIFLFSVFYFILNIFDYRKILKYLEI